MRIAWCVNLVLTLLIFVFGKYEVDMKYDYAYSGVYVYNTETNISRKSVQLLFTCIASVVCTSVEESRSVFDLRITGIHLIQKDVDGTMLGDLSSLEMDRNFSGPFSFAIQNEGGIADVKCLENEDEGVIRIKSAIVGEFITLGENETDELPVKTLDGQGVYMSHWKKERKGEGLELQTREFTDEDFIHLRNGDAKNGFIINVLEKKKINRGVLEKSTSEGHVVVGGSKFEASKRKMVHKKNAYKQNGDDDNEKYDGTEHYVVESSKMELFKTSNVPHKRRSLNEEQNLKTVDYMHWDFYSARASKILGDRQRKFKLGSWDDLYGTDDAPDAKYNLCPNENQSLDKVPDDTTVVRPPWVDEAASAAGTGRQLALSGEVDEALHDEFERNMTRGWSFESRKMQANGILDANRISCPDGLENCFNWAQKKNKGTGDFRLDFLANISIGLVPDCTKNCNFGVEADAHLSITVWGQTTVVFNISFGMSNIDGFHRNNHIEIVSVIKQIEYGPCRFNDINCATHRIDVKGPAKFKVNNQTDFSFNKTYNIKIFTIKLKVDVEWFFEIYVEFKICPPQGLLSIGPVVSVNVSIGVNGAIGGEYKGVKVECGANMNASTALDTKPEVGIDFMRNCLFLNAQIRWKPLHIWVEVFASVKILIIDINVKEKVLDEKIDTIVFVLWELKLPLPFSAVTILDPANPVPEDGNACDVQARRLKRVRMLGSKGDMGNSSGADKDMDGLAVADTLRDLLEETETPAPEKGSQTEKRPNWNMGKE